MPTIDGIASGLDTTAIIAAVTGVTAARKTPLLDKIDDWNESKDTLAKFSDKMKVLADKLDELVDPDKLVPLNVKSSSDAQFTVTTSEANFEGTFDVQVVSLARRASTQTNGFAARDALGTVGEGTLSITYAGVQHDLTIDGTNSSLDGVAAAIDELDGVRAYVVNTGTATNPFKLVITGEDTGAANSLSFDASGLTGGSAVAPTFTPLTTAADAHIQVNGLDVYSATNAVSEAVPGMTFNLVAEGTSSVQVDVSRGKDQLKAKLGEFVTAFNDIVKYYNTQTVFNADAKIRGGLVGESVARSAVNDLSRVLGTQFTVSGSAFEALSQVGIKSNQDGTISVDDTVFDRAFNDYYDDTVALLTSDAGPFTKLRDTVRDVYIDEDDGALKARSTTLESFITDTQERIDTIDKQVQRQEERLRKQYAALEGLMSQSQSTSAYLASMLYSSLGSSTS